MRRSEEKAVIAFSISTGCLALLLLGACSHTVDKVIITKQAPAIETKLFDPKAMDRPLPAPKPDETAETQWYFHLKPEIKYDVVSERALPSGEHVAVIEVRQLLLNLSLPITVWLPENASSDVREHENGHVKICTYVYEFADRAAAEAAQPVLKTVFQGQGGDATQAVGKAVDCAARALASEYRRNTSDVASRVSATYDEFAENSKGSLPAEQLVKEAFDRRGVDLAQGRNSF